MKKLTSLLLCLALLFPLPRPLKAGEPELSTGTNSLAATVLQDLTDPSPEDSTAILALLRGGWLEPQQETVAQYIAALLEHIATGGLTGQPLYETGLQALALAAAGVDVATYAPGLLAPLADATQLAAGGIPAAWAALIVFGAAGMPVPAGSGFSPAAYAKTLAAEADEDGSFGSALETGLAVAALARWQGGDETILNASVAAQLWQQQNISEAGVYLTASNEADWPATAHTMLSLTCLGYDPAFVAYDSSSMAEALLHGWQEGPLQEANNETQALCLLALTAKARYDSGRPAIFAMSDVVLQAELPNQAGESPSAPASRPQPPTELASPLSTGTVVAALLATLAALSLPTLLWAHKTKHKRPRR